MSMMGWLNKARHTMKVNEKYWGLNRFIHIIRTNEPTKRTISE
jgi:hypothetical protein